MKQEQDGKTVTQSRSHGGNVELLAPKYGFGIDEIIDFSANINPMGLPPEAGQILKDALENVVHYPDPKYSRLREVLARWHDVSPEDIAVGNGASELIFWMARLQPNSQALIFAPAFSEYAEAVESSGGAIRYETAEEKKDFEHSFLKAIPSGTHLVFIGNPNNPTGNLYEKKRLENWIGKNQRAETLFVIDESFMPFIEDENPYSLVPFAVKTNGVVVLRSLTKVFAVPGLRLGYAVGARRKIDQLNTLMPTWRVNIIAQRFGEKMFSYAKFLSETRSAIRKAKKNLIEQLNFVPEIKLFEGAVNFLLIKILRKEISAVKLTQEFARRGILIRCCNDFTGLQRERFIRIAVRKPEENDRFARVLKELLKRV